MWVVVLTLLVVALSLTLLLMVLLVCMGRGSCEVLGVVGDDLARCHRAYHEILVVALEAHEVCASVM